MFTGIIEKIASVIAFEQKGSSACLCLSNPWDDIALGESIAVNGVCLTSKSRGTDLLCFDVSMETLRCTTFTDLASNACVNLERAVHSATRMGGHYVSGHVDDTARIAKMQQAGDYVECIIEGFGAANAPLYLLPKASITVDGISLTINRVQAGQVFLMLVPHTLEHTNLAKRCPGDSINIEYDYLTRIVAHQLQIAGQLP